MTTTNTNRLADATRPTRMSANECIPRYIRLVQTKVHHIKPTAAHNAKGYCNKKKFKINFLKKKLYAHCKKYSCFLLCLCKKIIISVDLDMISTHFSLV